MKKTINFLHKLVIVVGTEVVQVVINLVTEINRQLSLSIKRVDESRINKLRHFKPTIHEGFWSTTTTWEERDEPLSIEEVEKLYK